MNKSPLFSLCQTLNLDFNDLSLLQTALTHRSYSHEKRGVADNERLEFLGDALLSALVAAWLFDQFPDCREGQLTRMRSVLVRRETLADMARECNLGQHLRIGRGERANQGHERVSTLANAFEALLAAIYKDMGYACLRGFLLPLLASRLPAAIDEALKKDARSRLQEWSQSKRNMLPIYETISSDSPVHAGEFVVRVRLADDESALGRGYSKQIAAHRAAVALLKQVARE